MIVVPESTLYEMTMFDHTEYHPLDHRPSLDKIATEVYGKKYVGQQTDEMLGNDSWHVYDMTTEDECQEAANLGDLEFYDDPYSRRYYFSVAGWLTRDTSNDDYDFQDYRTAPSPECMLATLILEGHLPYGRYLIEVSW